VDNAGFELVTDLCLADFLVTSGIASSVVFHLKSHPTFVSDAMSKDVMDTVDYFANADVANHPNTPAMGARWLKYVKDGRCVLAASCRRRQMRRVAATSTCSFCKQMDFA